VSDGTKAVGLYRADSQANLVDLLDALPMHDWMKITVTPLEPHPNDPGPSGPEAATALDSSVPGVIRVDQRQT
jgi:muconolactone delta-isomerase